MNRFLALALRSLSVRAIARKYQVSRRTVRFGSNLGVATAAQADTAPSKLDPFKPVIDDILRAGLEAPAEQRHAVKRIYDRLIAKHGMFDVPYSVVRAYVANPSRRAASRRGGDRSMCSPRRAPKAILDTSGQPFQPPMSLYG